MKNLKSAGLIVFIFTLLLHQNSWSQGGSKTIEWDKDTVSSYNAQIRKDKYHIYFEKDLRNVTPSIYLPVNKLKAIVDVCAAGNIQNIEFILAVIRPQDTARYFAKHPSLSDTDKFKVVNRQTLIIKVPREVAQQLSYGRRNQLQKFSAAMLALGYTKIDSGFGLNFEGSVYFDIGTICPPPEGCFQ